MPVPSALLLEYCLIFSIDILLKFQMKIAKLLVFVFSIFLLACTDNPIKIANKNDGSLSRTKEYDFHMMRISSIQAGDDFSSAKYCTPDFKDCWNLWYKGDLSDYKNDQTVNIKIKNLQVESISDPYFLSVYGYHILSIFMSHPYAAFFGTYFLAPIFTLFILAIMFFLFFGIFGKRTESSNE